MPYLTDDDMLALAQAALPERLRGAAAKVVRHAPAGVTRRQRGALEATDAHAHADADAALARGLEDLLKITLPAAPSPDDSADVQILEPTALGLRTTVVQIRDGVLARVIAKG
jgi:hypothetical protein